MKISQIQKDVVDNHSACLIRPRKEERVKGQPIQYDVKPLFTGNKKGGWVLLDAFTASALKACYDALNPENQAKWDRVPIMTLVDFAWKNVQ